MKQRLVSIQRNRGIVRASVAYTWKGTRFGSLSVIKRTNQRFRGQIHIKERGVLRFRFAVSYDVGSGDAFHTAWLGREAHCSTGFTSVTLPKIVSSALQQQPKRALEVNEHVMVPVASPRMCFQKVSTVPGSPRLDRVSCSFSSR
ncbi:hypothetical protein DNTS_001287 [Danionella cerebrum]|uniref:Uncharacterized protein n=1 Tax=Danionella cerebrum TaxID=2873325 RepID=A0A553Q3N4_9TELE|nr:hypothetical protein DNTS_001287 [Danionella translucida]